MCKLLFGVLVVALLLSTISSFRIKSRKGRVDGAVRSNRNKESTLIADRKGDLSLVALAHKQEKAISSVASGTITQPETNYSENLSLVTWLASSDALEPTGSSDKQIFEARAIIGQSGNMSLPERSGEVCERSAHGVVHEGAYKAQDLLDQLCSLNSHTTMLSWLASFICLVPCLAFRILSRSRLNRGFGLGKLMEVTEDITQEARNSSNSQGGPSAPRVQLQSPPEYPKYDGQGLCAFFCHRPQDDATSSAREALDALCPPPHKRVYFDVVGSSAVRSDVTLPLERGGMIRSIQQQTGQQYEEGSFDIVISIYCPVLEIADDPNTAVLQVEQTHANAHRLLKPGHGFLALGSFKRRAITSDDPQKEANLKLNRGLEVVKELMRKVFNKEPDMDDKTGCLLAEKEGK